MFIYRQEMYEGPVDKDGNSLEGRAEIIVGNMPQLSLGIGSQVMEYLTADSIVKRRAWGVSGAAAPASGGWAA